MAKITARRQKFILEYLVDFNATQAAIRAGYSRKTARSTGYELLNIPEVKQEIEECRAAMAQNRVADIQEIMEFLTAVMRGETTEEALVVLRVGGGKTNAVLIPKGPSMAVRLKAAEDLGKRYGLFTERISLADGLPLPVVISGADDLEDAE